VTFSSTRDLPRSSKPRLKSLSGLGSLKERIDILLKAGNPSSSRSGESSDREK